MKRREILFVAVALLAVSPVSPVSAQRHGADTTYGSSHDMPTDDIPRPVSRDAASQAAELRMSGKCDKAVPILRRVVNNGGSEISQFNLGMCLLDLAAADRDAQRAAPMTAEGAQWIVLSANAGFPQAQSKAVALYLDGVGVPPDPVEAKKWELLYKRNVDRALFGLPDIQGEVVERLDVAVTGDKRAEARARANRWTKVPVSNNE